jgi:tRNA-dihydrouridine synthase B
LENCDEQLAALDRFFEFQLAYGDRLQYRLGEEKLAA